MDRGHPRAPARPKARRASSATRRCCKKAGEKLTAVAEIVIPPGPRLGQTSSIEAEGCAKATATMLIDGLNFKLPPGGIVGVIGPNGAGKTTLFRMITGQEQPDGGTIASARR